MKTIEERAKEFAGKTPAYIPARIAALRSGYIQGAFEQRDIDIRRTCDYLERYTCMFISPSGFLDVENFIKDFVATMERE